MKKTAKKITKNKRPSWDKYFLGIANYVSLRATCDRGRTGCVIVRDKRIISTGYVGSHPGLPHCDEAGHDLHKVINEDGEESSHCLRTIHAEQNALAQAARFGVSLDGATLYGKLTPCYACAKSIIAVGIKRVVMEKDYHASEKSKEVFKKAGVKLEVLGEMQTYKDM